MNTGIPPKLRWACRRGMLELDVLLGNFLTEAYVHQTHADQVLFEELLTTNDQSLYEWLTGRTPVSELHLADIVEKVREHAKHRHHS